MHVTLRSDDSPDVCVGTEACNLAKLDQHIRTLQAARRWLLTERKRLAEKRKEQEKQALKEKPQEQQK
jgi:hypothetical protein